MTTGQSTTSATPSQIAGEFLEKNSDRLVTDWIEWVKSRVHTSTVSGLPERALRNHIPPILRSLGQYVRNPVELVRQQLLSELRLHGQIRRDQGYSLEEVLAEFDGLADVVIRQVSEEIESRVAEAPVARVLEAMSRLSGGLRSVSYIAMGTFTRFENDRQLTLSESLEEFARAVGHELRNPLNAIALSLHSLREGVEDADTKKQHLEIMEGSLRHCAYLLDTVHVLAVAEGARAGGRMIGIAPALSRIREELSDQCRAYGVSFLVQDDLPDLEIEAVPLYIVLANTIGNSIKYSDPNKNDRWVSITARYVEEAHDSGLCEIQVSDNGVGIPEEFVSRVFQKEFRAHPDRAVGTGHGLYIVQKAVHSRGGTVAISSGEGEGTTVTIRMRCLVRDRSALTADQFRVEFLMGEEIWGEGRRVEGCDS